MISFFRDPERTPPGGEDTVVSHADGAGAEVGEVDTCPFLEGRALRIGIFLSVFNVHVNRSPLAGRVAHLEHADGEYLNALDPASAARNERQDLGLLDQRRGLKVLVRQIAGAIARRIVCKAEMGQDLARGARYGMIKFGSRTEVYLPAGRFRPRVKVGDKVKGGQTALGDLI